MTNQTLKRATFNVKARPELRARVEACAAQIGATVPEFVRISLIEKCDAVERVRDQRAAVAAGRTWPES